MSDFAGVPPSTEEYRNIASGEARVGMQVGAHQGDVIVHGNLTSYTMSGSETPEQKVESGIQRLLGGMPRDAEVLLGDAFDEGRTGPRTGYYWALAILGGRTRDQLEEVHLRKLDRACGVLSCATEGAWAPALRVIRGLVDLLRLSDGHNVPDAPDQEQVLAAYNHLDPERSMEIRRYLDQILDGVLLDRMYQEHAEEVERERTTGRRDERAKKFFEPDPVPPERVPPPPRPPRAGAWTKLLAGVAVVLAAGYPATTVLAHGGVFLVFGLILLVVGLATMIRHGLRRRFVLDEREAEEGKFAAPTVDGRRWNPKVEAPFFNSVTAGAFGKAGPDDKDERTQWKEETEGYRLKLTKEFAEYQNPEVHFKQSRLRWLARWHAERLARQWNENNYEDVRVRFALPRQIYLGMLAAAAMTVVGAALCWWPLWVYGGMVEYLLFPVLIASGLRVACDQGCRLASSARVYSRAQESTDRRYREESEAYGKWCEYLSDQPEDVEMARWLDYDKRYLRVKAMDLFGVSNPAVVAHVTLSRPHWGPWARVPGGPKRYVSYVMTVILMTKTGVRLARFHLDVRDGEASELERHSFRYDNIASVHVTQAYTGAVPLPDQRPAGPEAMGQSKERRSARYRTVFRIILVNQEKPIDTFLDALDHEFSDDQEESHELAERAIEPPGVTGALRMMEAITADGKEWLQTQENQRRRRRLYRSPAKVEEHSETDGGRSRTADRAERAFR